jgi:Holliday junction resolvasome RuvABC endonuclease subunit
MIVAFDPGPKTIGWASVEGRGPSVAYRAGGMLASRRDAARALLEEHRPAAVAVEVPDGFVHAKYRGPTLLATARVAGGLSWLAEGEGLLVVELPAAAWRQTLVQRPHAKDAVIKLAVERLVTGLPARTCVHVRDALGLAVVASWILRGLRRSETFIPCNPGGPREGDRAWT